MTLRLKILRELRQFYSGWPNSWLGTRDISAYRRDADQFAVAAHELETEDLILKTGGADAGEPGFLLDLGWIAVLRREFAPPMWWIFLTIGYSLLAAVAAYWTSCAANWRSAIWAVRRSR